MIIFFQCIDQFGLSEVHNVYLCLFYRAHCLATDLDECIPLIKLNIENNSKEIRGSIEAKTLDWSNDVTLPPPDYLLLADCIYYDKVGP